jgi:hypothetical protein
MKAITKASIAAGCAALFVGALAAPSTASPKPTITGTGTVSCKVAGKVTFTPPLVNGGTTAATATLKANLVGCTGSGDGATISTGKATGTVSLATNDCAALASIPAFDVTVHWKTTGGAPQLVDTTVSFSGATTDTSSGSAVVDASGSASAGSFAGTSAATHDVVTRSLASLSNACSHRGVRKVNFAASNSTAALS